MAPINTGAVHALGVAGAVDPTQAVGVRVCAMTRVLYFGCIDRPGHFLIEGRKSVHPRQRDIPWTEEQLDMTLCPGVVEVSYGHKADKQVEGHAKLHHRDGWTALAFWDRSVDGRMNCNSVFVIEGEHVFDDAKRIAMAAYPHIWKRFKFEVKLS
jgi:hypothetical protein